MPCNASLFALLLLPFGALCAQKFDVVSVRPGPAGTVMELARSGKLHSVIDDAQVDLGGLTLFELIQIAWDLPDDQISAPSWLNQLRFDVHATLPPGATKKDVPDMMKAMLAERFGLVVHHDEKVKPVYALTQGKTPPRLKLSDPDNSGPSGGRGGDPDAVPGAEMSIADAVKDLGLRLEPTKHAFDIIVIDHIERTPAEN
jgi:hypothetical protein